jgi:hypothetical protein
MVENDKKKSIGTMTKKIMGKRRWKQAENIRKGQKKIMEKLVVVV